METVTLSDKQQKQRERVLVAAKEYADAVESLDQLVYVEFCLDLASTEHSFGGTAKAIRVVSTLPIKGCFTRNKT